MKKFGKYVLMEKLGEGGTGAVYKAYHPTLKSYFALKIVLASKVGKEGLSRFEREARVSFKLKHPNIVQVHDQGIEGQKHYIVMDYIEGKDLGKLIKEKRFWPQRAFELILLVSRALQYSHDEGVVHRDIKPSNILVVGNESKDIPYLMDFGLASVVEEDGLTRTGQIMGTPQYMSPEQAEGRGNLDGRSDIYSLGAVLYEMLSGKPVVESDHVMAIIYEVLHKDPPPLSKWVPGIAKDVEAIIMKCLEKEPSRRYQTPAELAEDLERYLRGEAVLARSPGRLYKIWRKIIRNWKASAIVAGLIIIAIGIVIFCIVNIPAERLKIQIVSLEEEAKNQEKQGNLKGAGNIYLSILKLDKDNMHAKDSLVFIKRGIKECAIKWETDGNLRDAKKSYMEILELDKEFRDAKDGTTRIKEKIKEEWDKANELGGKKYFDKALEICRKLIEWDPNDERFGEYISELTQRKESCRKEAREYYDRAMEVFWNPKLNEAEIEKCKWLFERAIEIDPTFSDAHFQAGRASHRLFDTQKAMEHYNKSHEYDATLTPPKYYMTALEMPSILETSREKNKPLNIIHLLDEGFNKIWSGNKTVVPNISLETSDPYTLLAKTQCLLAKLHILRKEDEKQYQSMWEECMKYCETVIYKASTFSDAYFIRAQLYSYLVEIRENASHNILMEIEPKDMARALEDCAQGIYLDPFRMEFYSLRGSIYSSIGAYDLAEKDYTKALLLKNIPKAEFYRKRAMCYIAMGNPELSLQDLDQNIKLTEKEAVYPQERIDALMWRAGSKACLKDKKGAEEDLEKCISFIKNDQVYAKVFPVELHKTLIYTLIDENTNRVENEFKKLLTKGDLKVLKSIQLFFLSLSRESSLCFQHIIIFLENIDNLFCAPPESKKSKEGALLLSLLRKSKEYESPEILEKHLIMNLDDLRHSIMVRICMNTLHQDQVGKEKLNKINTIFQKEYPPLTADLFLYCTSCISEHRYVKNLLNLKELPSASLYYRRAIEQYINKDYKRARDDLEAALDLEPNYMEAHYGLSTVYSILAEKDPSYRNMALNHLKHAVYTGWSHIEDYTMKDDDFKSLGLGKEVSLDELRSWDKKREENKSLIEQFKENVEELISKGYTIGALRLLYEPKPEFFPRLFDFSPDLERIVDSSEKRVMDTFLKNMEEGKEEDGKKELDIDKKIEHLFGERGRIMWEWAKRSEHKKD